MKPAMKQVALEGFLKKKKKTQKCIQDYPDS